MNLKHTYSDDIAHKVIGVIGITPPVLGGVSIHVERVIDRFTYALNKVHVFNPEQGRRGYLVYAVKLIVWLLWYRPEIVYFHATYMRSCLLDLCIVRLCAREESIVIVEHDCRHMYRRSAFFKRWYQWVLESVKSVVFIGGSAYASYEDAGMEVDTYSVESAFLPPSLSSEHLIRTSYPSSLSIFLKECTPVIFINAAHLMRSQDGHDVYGLYDTLDLVACLKERYPDIGLLIALATIDDQDYWQVLQDRMKELGIAQHVYVLQGNYYMWPLFKDVDVFIRPTRSDGESVSVQEALFFGVPIVASNAVSRPTGIRLFKTGDGDDFAAVVDQVLKEQIYGKHNKRGYLYTQSPG